jgi:NAD+ diphosphatase
MLDPRATRFASPRPNPLSDPDFDRAAQLRTDAAWLEAILRSPKAKVTPVWRSKSLVAPAGDLRQAALLPAPDFAWDAAAETVFLGLDGETALFAVDVSALEPDAAEAQFGRHGAFEDMRGIGLLLPNADAALLAYARGMLWWHERHRFCGVCGARTRVIDAGHRRLCTNETCKTEQFPRSDPAVIMLIEHDDRCLLARGARFPANFVSVLAGFVEPGESLEDTVAREVFEECGVRVTDIAYSSSQPWPFPSSLMLGFRARALDDRLTLDHSEILEAAWHTRDSVRSLAESGTMRIPPPFSISRRLIDDWVAEDNS